MSRTNCDHCKALVTPGAPFCLACFLPFEDEPAAAPPPPAAPAADAPAPGYGAPYGAPYGAQTGAPAGAPYVPNGVPYGAAPYAQPYGAPVPAGVGAPAASADAAGGFYAAPPPAPYASHPGQAGDWRATAPMAALATQPRRQPSRTPMVVAGVVALVVLVGAVLGARALFSQPSEKEQFATAFREARPPDFLPSFPDLGSMTSGLDAEPEAPGAAKAYVQSIDGKVQAANAALLAMQETMDRWADGKVTDDALREAIRGLDETLTATATTDAMFEAPQSTRRGLGKLAESATEYRLAMSALLDWLDSRSGGSRMTFRLTIGSANVHWDEGLINLYRAAGMPAPDLPHPQPQR